MAFIEGHYRSTEEPRRLAMPCQVLILIKGEPNYPYEGHLVDDNIWIGEKSFIKVKDRYFPNRYSLISRESIEVISVIEGEEIGGDK